MSERRQQGSPSLRTLQESFWALVSAPAGVADALAAEPGHAWLAGAVVGDGCASALERLDVYANMYFYRLRDNLALDFPKLSAVVGDTAFHNLITDYLQACPSQEPSVRHLGRRLPAFLCTHGLCQRRPWLADLAALEWARLDVFDRADEAALTVADLQQAAAVGFSDLRLQFIEAHAVVRTERAVDLVWRAVQDNQEPADPATVSRAALLVWRQPDLCVYHRRLEAAEAELVPRLEAGFSFVELCEVLAARLSNDEAAQMAVRLLRSWAHAGLLKR